MSSLTCNIFGCSEYRVHTKTGKVQFHDLKNDKRTGENNEKNALAERFDA